MVTQAMKLGLKPGVSGAIDGAPWGWSLEQDFVYSEGTPVDVLIAFVHNVADLDQRLAALSTRIYPRGALWIAWPRKAAGHLSDLGDGVVRERILAAGLVDTKIAALDHDWSALKVVWRLVNREAPPRAIQ